MSYRTVSGYERRNRNVLRHFLKAASDGAAVTFEFCVHSSSRFLFRAWTEAHTQTYWCSWSLNPCYGCRMHAESTIFDLRHLVASLLNRVRGKDWVLDVVYNW